MRVSHITIICSRIKWIWSGANTYARVRQRRMVLAGHWLSRSEPTTCQHYSDHCVRWSPIRSLIFKNLTANFSTNKVTSNIVRIWVLVDKFPHCLTSWSGSFVCTMLHAFNWGIRIIRLVICIYFWLVKKSFSSSYAYFNSALFMPNFYLFFFFMFVPSFLPNLFMEGNFTLCYSEESVNVTGHLIPLQLTRREPSTNTKSLSFYWNIIIAVF